MFMVDDCKFWVTETQKYDPFIFPRYLLLHIYNGRKLVYHIMHIYDREKKEYKLHNWEIRLF